mmetsp:Transcript_28477/g.45773  ORF Transcript_28477/g.45773 Transcript_28477/m.45773 type:complete len:238 (-) Transcript_28477:26-739(-)
MPGYESLNTSSVMSTSSDTLISRPVSSLTSLAATPAKFPSPSSIPAGISTISPQATGTRGCRTTKVDKLSFPLPSLCLKTTRTPTEPPRINAMPGTCFPSTLTVALSFIKPTLGPNMSTLWIRIFSTEKRFSCRIVCNQSFTILVSRRVSSEVFSKSVPASAVIVVNDKPIIRTASPLTVPLAASASMSPQSFFSFSISSSKDATRFPYLSTRSLNVSRFSSACSIDSDHIDETTIT